MTKTQSFTEYLIVGGGHAGCVAAAAARTLDPEGAIRIVSEETVLPYERPPLSKRYLTGEIDIEAMQIKSRHHLKDLNIEVMLGVRAAHIATDEKAVNLDDGSIVYYEKLLLATGSSVRRLGVPGSDLMHVHYLRTEQDSRSLRDTLARANQLVVIGAGFIGLEVAATARDAFDCEVTVIEVGPEVLQRAAPERLRIILRELHERRGVQFLMRQVVTEFIGDDTVSGVELASGQTLPTDAVLICIGVDPNTQLAETAGIAAMDGIVTDEFGRTAVRDIYAAGEVARHVLGSAQDPVRYESWQMAQNQAATVGRNMAGAREPIDYVPWFWTDQYGHNVQLLGRTDADGRQVVRQYDDQIRSSAVYIEGNTVVGALCVDSGGDVPAIRRAIKAGASVRPARIGDTKVRLKSALELAR